MKNYEKYTSPEQRSGAFWEFCRNGTEKYTILNAMQWLEEEAEPPWPCPFCEGKTECHKEWNGKYRVVCTNPDCWYSGSLFSTETGAISEHNRVAVAAAMAEAAQK